MDVNRNLEMPETNHEDSKSGRVRSGKARMEKLTPEERRLLAKQAAEARWATQENTQHEENLPIATHKGNLPIGETNIPCAVLDNGTRVLTENGITNALLGSRSGASKRLKKTLMEEGAQVPLFLAPKNLIPFISQDLINGPLKPIRYLDGARLVIGYDANALPSVCEIWLQARQSGKLQDQQQEKAQKAEMLMRSLAHVAIVALVDEATGYQDERPKDALQELLQRYLRKELAVWAKTFPDEFYQEIYRLRGWEWKGMSVNRYSVVGHYTIDLVYQRLAPGLLKELQERNPKTASGRRKHSYPQWLTEDIGHPALRQHLYALIAFMRSTDTWDHFYSLVSKAFPKKGDNLSFDFR